MKKGNTSRRAAAIRTRATDLSCGNWRLSGIQRFTYASLREWANVDTRRMEREFCFLFLSPLDLLFACFVVVRSISPRLALKKLCPVHLASSIDWIARMCIMRLIPSGLAIFFFSRSRRDM